MNDEARQTHFVDLPPLSRLFLHEASVNGGHDFIEVLAGHEVHPIVRIDKINT